MKKDEAYKIIQAKLLEQLETKGSDWTESWVNNESPKNAFTKRPFRGMNTFFLGLQGYSCPDWATKRAWKKNGYEVKEDAESTVVLHFSMKPKSKKYWTDLDKSHFEATGESPNYPSTSVWYEFNGEQVEGYEWEPIESRETLELTTQVRNNFDAFVSNTGAKIEHHGSPSYNFVYDVINMPEEKFFDSDVDYCSTLGHELVHWTGHEKRLKRNLTGNIGQPNYAYEELVAEIGSAFLCGLLRIEKTPRDDHAVYINHWKKIIQDDMKAVNRAFSHAQKAVDFLDNLQNKKAAA